MACERVCIVPALAFPERGAGTGPNHWYQGRLWEEIHWAEIRWKLGHILIDKPRPK